jgi:hypothetical protein
VRGTYRSLGLLGVEIQCAGRNVRKHRPDAQGEEGERNHLAGQRRQNDFIARPNFLGRKNRLERGPRVGQRLRPRRPPARLGKRSLIGRRNVFQPRMTQSPLASLRP